MGWKEYLGEARCIKICSEAIDTNHMTTTTITRRRRGGGQREVITKKPVPEENERQGATQVPRRAKAGTGDTTTEWWTRCVDRCITDTMLRPSSHAIDSVAGRKKYRFWFWSLWFWIEPLSPLTNMSSEGLLQGRRVLVTGSTRGIGRALASVFAGHGASVLTHGSGRYVERPEITFYFIFFSQLDLWKPPFQGNFLVKAFIEEGGVFVEGFFWFCMC